MSSPVVAYQPKRRKYMSRWETSLYEINRDAKPSASLQELFDVEGWLESRTRKTRTSSSCCSRPRPRRQGAGITFRLEHRQIGALAAHQGEERILLFRSDRKGAIAKIVYNSSAPAGKNMAAQARVQVLEVKDDYRGLDMGGLLFSSAMFALKQRYLQEDSNGLVSVRCELDAEEDIRRHNKLISFYERRGCVVKPGIRPQFINNNDGETYRKVPMQIHLRRSPASRVAVIERKQQEGSLLLGNTGEFLPVWLLAGADHKRGKRACWLMSNDGSGYVQFRTTEGLLLTVDPQGRCLEENDPAESDTSKPERLSNFLLLRVSDTTQRLEQKSDLSSNEKELWILWSPHGTFLKLDPVSQKLEASKTPCFWQANSQNELTLACVFDTPTRRQHYRQGWIRQTVDFVLVAKERYLDFKLARLPLKEALRLVKACPAFPFRLDPALKGISLRTLCFRTAEFARDQGHPDWIQFVALIHALGSVANCIDIKTAIESEDEYDWTVSFKSRVVGCASSVDSSFAEFSYLNVDRNDERYKGAAGMYNLHCGLENVHLTWSGPEYLYHMLRHNDIDLPDEGFAVLRLFPLYDWHAKKLYDCLTNDDDREILPFVEDFDRLRRQALSSVEDELTDADCDRLWSSYYARLAAKFGADDVLDW